MADQLNISVKVTNNAIFISNPIQIQCNYVCADNESAAFRASSQGSFFITNQKIRLPKVSRHNKNLYFWCVYLNDKYYFKQDISSYNTTNEYTIDVKLQKY